MGIEIEYPLGYASSGDTLFRDTGTPSCPGHEVHAPLCMWISLRADPVSPSPPGLLMRLEEAAFILYFAVYFLLISYFNGSGN